MLTGHRLGRGKPALGQRRKKPFLDGGKFAHTPWLGLAALLVAVLLAAPAFAQFGSIFRDEPPRPPADVPQGTPPPQYYPPPQNYPPPPRNYPQRQQNYPRPPAGIRSDSPPAEPLPAPMSLPPEDRPNRGTIQSQPLAPPPGAAPAQPTKASSNAALQLLRSRPCRACRPASASRAAPLQQPADIAPPPNDEVVVEPPPQRISNPTAIFSGLDKITGRIIKFDVAINETVQFGALQVTPRVCYSRPPTETPNTDAFVEVDEVTLQGEIKRIFTGWMFAASPGLHAVEHPIYDVWLTDCKGGEQPAVAEAPAEPPQAKPPAKRPAPRTDQRGFLPALR